MAMKPELEIQIDLWKIIEQKIDTIEGKNNVVTAILSCVLGLFSIYLAISSAFAGTFCPEPAKLKCPSTAENYVT